MKENFSLDYTKKKKKESYSYVFLLVYKRIPPAKPNKKKKTQKGKYIK